MADLDPALVQQVLDVAQRKGKADVHHYRHADDFWARLEVAERAAFAHAARLGGMNDKGKKVPLTLPRLIFRVLRPVERTSLRNWKRDFEFDRLAPIRDSGSGASVETIP